MIPTVDQAVALHQAGRLAEAEQCYRTILGVEPKTIGAFRGLGTVLLQTDRAAEAAEPLQTALDIEPDNADTLNNLGSAQLQLGQLDNARKTYEQAVALSPSHNQAQANLGVALFKLDDLERSVVAFQAAISTNPNNAETHYNYSRTLRALGRLDDAEQAARQALDLTPDHADARINLGVAQAAMGKRSEAEASYRQALDVNPRAAAAHHNLAQILLQSGRFKEGWEAFEWRWHTPDFQGADAFRALPAWTGSPMDQGTLLVWTEQGVGDQILYAGIFPDLKDKASDLLIASTERLAPLFARSFPFATVVAQPDLQVDQKRLSSIVAQIPAGSLGQYLRPSEDAFGARPAFLTAESDKTAALKSKYDAQFGDALRIGLSWRSGNPRFGAAKSLALTDLASLFEAPSTVFIDLQYGDTADEHAVLQQSGGHTLHRDPYIDSLADLDTFAAQVAAMDLVVTAPNTTAHMAGALGVPCWVLVPTGPGLLWYWFLDRSDSPWYPSLRLFRQAPPGDWAPVVQQVNAALAGFVSSHPGTS